MATVKNLIDRMATPRVFAGLADEIQEELRKDEVVKRLFRRAKLSKRDARLLIGMVSLTALEVLIKDLKRNLPWR